MLSTFFKFNNLQILVSGLFSQMTKKTKAPKAEIPHYQKHRERLRQKYAKAPEGFHEYELLELLLTYSIPRIDVKPLAKELLTEYGSLAGVICAEAEELSSHKGIGPNTIVFFNLMRDITSRSLGQKAKEKNLMQSPSQVLDFAKTALAGHKDEAFLVIYVNVKNRMENYEIINEGTVDQVVIYPRNVIKNALKHHSTAIIVVHNHPSGECDPSGADIRLTESLKKASSAMDIKLLDHMIVGGSEYFSFLEEGLL